MIKNIYRHLRSQYRLYVWWKMRIKDVLDCQDNNYIPRVNNAGRVRKGYQIMHNGIIVKKNGYYGNGITKMLHKNKGVHEPQEERVFTYILDKLPQQATMIELGAFWSFYSMWFLKEIKGGKTYLFEPNEAGLAIGKLNYDANGFHGDFNNVFISDKVNMDTVPAMVSIDHILIEKNIDFIDILHADIEGFELNMLNGATRAIEQSKIGYFVISTHSNDLHYSCLDFLKRNNFIIICEADLLNTYSYDGLIVARSVNYAGIDPVEISQKQKA